MKFTTLRNAIMRESNRLRQEARMLKLESDRLYEEADVLRRILKQKTIDDMKPKRRSKK